MKSGLSHRQMGNEVDVLRENVAKNENWFVAQSNPSFEVWLYYHFEKKRPDYTIENWKEFLNNVVKGGFNPKKHPVCIQTAIVNAEANIPTLGDKHSYVATTEVSFSKENITSY